MSFSQPVLSTRCTVAPSTKPYSCNSLLSASALPLMRRRCAETGGADAVDADTRDLSWATESDGDAVTENVRAGLRDLTVMLMVSAVVGERVSR
jgi:hypothetical protein